jgi:hypothetical protein
LIPNGYGSKLAVRALVPWRLGQVADSLADGAAFYNHEEVKLFRAVYVEDDGTFWNHEVG